VSVCDIFDFFDFFFKFKKIIFFIFLKKKCHVSGPCVTRGIVSATWHYNAMCLSL